MGSAAHLCARPHTCATDRTPGYQVTMPATVASQWCEYREESGLRGTNATTIVCNKTQPRPHVAREPPLEHTQALRTGHVWQSSRRTSASRGNEASISKTPCFHRWRKPFWSCVFIASHSHLSRDSLDGRVFGPFAGRGCLASVWRRLVDIPRNGDMLSVTGTGLPIVVLLQVAGKVV
jgi:hypothetical protein